MRFDIKALVQSNIVAERPLRSESREAVELKQLKIDRPELASAVDMQLALIDTARRVQSRVPLPWIQPNPEWLRTEHAAGRPLVRFSDIPLDWTDFRLLLRQTADILHRFDALDQADYEAALALGRDGNLELQVIGWYEATSAVNEGAPRIRTAEHALARFDQVLVLALRPFISRCTGVLIQQVELSSWGRGYCPFCGWEPSFGVITPSAGRHLICGRCTAQWPFDPYACPFCANGDRATITSFTSRDGRYRVYGCDVCRRYLKVYDARNAPRPVMIAVDDIATLLLDAAALQRGYVE